MASSRREQGAGAIEPGGRFQRRGAGQNRGEVLRPVAELLVQGHVFGTVGEGEQAAAPDAPTVEDFQGGLQQALGHAAVPVFRQHGERAKKGERPPAGGHVRADEPAALARGDHLDVCGAPARCQEVAVAHEVEGVGHLQKRSECQPHNAVRLIQLARF